MKDTLQPVKDASHLYPVERRARHAERPGFRINELQISPTQQVPWHFHTHIRDTFYALDGTRTAKRDSCYQPIPVFLLHCIIYSCRFFDVSGVGISSYFIIAFQPRSFHNFYFAQPARLLHPVFAG